MGCDIHGIWQAKKDAHWVDVPSEWDQEPHYLLFGWLSGVRDANQTGIAPLRGLPDDFVVNLESEHATALENFNAFRRRHYQEGEPFWMGDHSHSWVTADEILAAPIPSDADGRLDYFIEEVRRLKDLHGEVRLVFGFDS